MTEQIANVLLTTIDGETIIKTSLIEGDGKGGWRGGYVVNNGEPQKMSLEEIKRFLNDVPSRSFNLESDHSDRSARLDPLLRRTSPTGPTLLEVLLGKDDRTPPRTRIRPDPFAGMLKW